MDVDGSRDILILGDGDFSYSVNLLPICVGSCLTSTVFLSEKEVLATYGNAAQNNIDVLKENNARVLFCVDATSLLPEVSQKVYDSIHFNFPHTGGKSKISENRQLLLNTFNSLTTILKPAGNVEIALLPGQGGTPADGEKLRSKGNNWNILDAAAQAGFILYSVEKFNTKCYNLTGYRGRSKSFLCDNGLRHKFIFQPFRSSSMTEVLSSPLPGSYLEKHLQDTNLSDKSLSFKSKSVVGSFDELLSIVVNECTSDDNVERVSKRVKLSTDESIDNLIMKSNGLESKKSIFYTANQTRVLYPTCITHDVSLWTNSEHTPNIIPVLLDCVGLALHKVTMREAEPYFNETTQKYSHCFSVTYSHPCEAVSESLAKNLAHVTVRNCLIKHGFELH